MKRYLLTLHIAFLLLTTAAKAQVLPVINCSEIDRPGKVHFYIMQDLHSRDKAYIHRTLDTVKRWAATHNDPKLIWYADLYEIVHPSNTQKAGEEDKALLAESKKFENAPYAEIRGAYYFFLGSVYYQTRNFELSFIYYMRANDIFEFVGYKNLPMVGHYFYSFFYLYFNVGDYPSAVKLLTYLIDNCVPKIKYFFRTTIIIWELPI